MKLNTAFLTLTALAGLILSSQAISLPPTGTTPNAFPAAPTLAEGWSTLNVLGTEATVTTAAELDAAVQNLSATNITTALGSSATVPPSVNNIARWNSANLNIQTRPSDNAFLVLMATLTNDTGRAVTSLNVGYVLGRPTGIAGTDVIEGHRVYFSLTGESNSWQLISGLTTGTPGTLDVTFSVGAWPAGSALYLLWADDNAVGVDYAYTIDNFFVKTPAIQVGSTGSGTLTFDTLPLVTEWSTRTNAGAGGDITTVAGLDTAAKTNVASTINASLVTDTAAGGNIFTAAAWNSANKNLQTKATSSGYTTLMATLQNKTGSSAIGVTISYDFGVLTSGAAEQIPGLRAFYSLTGAAASWTLIPEFSTNTAATLTATITNLSWAANAPLYLLWVDDNATTTEGAYTIDNFSAAADTTPYIAIATPTNGQTFAQGVAIPVTTVVNSITNVDFYVDGNLYSSDGTAPFAANFAACSLAAGTYALMARGTTTAGATLDSATINFTVVSNAAPIISLAAPTPASVLVGTAVTNVATVSDDVAVASVDFYLDGNKVYTRTATPWRYAYNDSTPGTHQIYAVATDNCGSTNLSGTVSVTVTNPTADYLLLVTNGGEWKWFADATGPTADWTQPGFNDSGWSNGIAELGFGDNAPAGGTADFYPEVTLLPKGSPQYITYYFRKSFNVTDASLIQNLSVRLLCDDGGVVHLNGQPIWTNNFAAAQMANAITNGTLAQNAVSEGTIYEVWNIPAPFPAGLLLNGANEIAVEVHQSGTASSDLSFDLMLWGQVQAPPTVLITAPTQGQSFAGGCAGVADVTVTAVASFFVNNVSFTLDGTTTLVAPNTASPFSVVFPGVTVGTHSVEAVAMDTFSATTNSQTVAFHVASNAYPTIAITNVFATNFVGSVTNGPFLVGACAINQLRTTDDGTVTNVAFFVNGALHFQAATLGQVVVNDLRAGTNIFQAVAWDNCGVIVTSAPVHVVVTNPPQTVLLANGLEWKYWYSNSAPALQGSIPWSETNYDDTLWLNGFAELGYDDSAQNNPESTNIDPTNLGYDAAYFRRTFQVQNAGQLTNLIINLLEDDGGIVYINGQEVFRSHMPTGTVSYATYANLTEPSDGTVYYQTNINPAGILRDGLNTVAVEVHQVSASSSDISFDLMLWAEGSSTPPPMAISFNGTDVLVTWLGTGFKLQQKNDLSPSVSWDNVPGNPQNTYSVPASSASGMFYKLVPQ